MHETTAAARGGTAQGMPGRIAYRISDALYVSVTNACTLRCRFCPKTRGDYVVKGYDLALSRHPRFEEVVSAIGDPGMYAEVVFCGFGEPTLRLRLLKEVARWLKARGSRVRANTDGLANLVHRR